MKTKSYNLTVLLFAVIIGSLGLVMLVNQTQTTLNLNVEERNLLENSVKIQHLLNTSRIVAAPIAVPAFNLITSGGTSITETDLYGQWSLMAFGFTSCPDFCPATLQTLAALMAMMDKNELLPPQVFFVTVDPERDDIVRLEEYVKYFDERFLPITGDASRVKKFNENLGVVVEKRYTGVDEKKYSVDHTISLLLIDPEGKMVAKINPPFIIDHLISDLNNLTSNLM